MSRDMSYKDSKVDWIGSIPKHWSVQKIKYQSLVKRGASPRPIDDSKYFDENGEYAWVRIADVSKSNMYLEETTQRMSELGSFKSVKREPGDIFVSIAGTVGKPCITKIKCCIHDGFVYFPSYTGDKKFLYYLFDSGMPYRGLGKMGTQLNLNTDTIGNIFIPAISIKEQKIISSFLDLKVEEINRLINMKEKLIALLEEKRQSIITETVTKGLNPDVKKKNSGVEWIGEIPKHWNVKKIKNLSLVKRGASPRPIDDQKYFDEHGEFAWVRIADVSSSDMYLENTKEKLSELGSSLSVKMYPGDIFLSIAATVGKPCITRIKCCIHDGFVYFPHYKEEKNYLYFIFVSGEPYKGLGKMGTQLNLNTDTVGEIKIPVPPIEEQKEISNFLLTEVEDNKNLIRTIEGQIEKLREYRQSLIYEAVTGKIDVREMVSGK